MLAQFDAAQRVKSMLREGTKTKEKQNGRVQTLHTMLSSILKYINFLSSPSNDAAEFKSVQTLLKTRSPALSAPRVVSDPTVLTGTCFCVTYGATIRMRTHLVCRAAATCGMAMTLRTGKGGRYRYYTCSIRARQGETGCKGRSIPMEKLERGITLASQVPPLPFFLAAQFASTIDWLVAKPVSGST